MNEKQTKSYDWIRQIPSSLLQWDDTPLLGSAPTFPWAQFSKELSKILGISDIAITNSDTQWRSEDDFYHGIPNPITQHFSVNGMEGSITWVMPKDDVAKLMANLLAQKAEADFQPDEELFASFYKFIAVEAIHTISQVKFDPTLSIHLLEEGSIPDEAALCTDIEMKFGGKSVLGRLLVSSAFRASWANHYTPKTPDAYLKAPLSEKLDVTVHLEAGQTYLPRSQWDEVNTGDFMLLDNCWIDPKNNHGSIRMLVKGVPLFSGVVDDGKIKILENSQLQHVERQQEVEKVMVDNSYNPEDEFGDDFDDDFDFDDSAFDDDFGDDFEDEHTEGSEETEEHTEFGEETSTEEERKAEAPAPEKKKAPAVVAEKASEVVRPEELPLAISVEVGRFQMSIKKLMELEPGNLLELGVKPENGVDLVMNGKCIARGELLRIGDTLGVRILEKS